MKGIKGLGVWKMNVSHLTNKEFIEGVNALIYRSLNKSFANPVKKWEYLKFDIRDFAKEFAVRKAMERRKSISNIEKRLCTLHKKLNMINLKAENAVRLIKKVNVKIDKEKSEMEKHTRYEAQGIMLRAKVRWSELAEKNTKYFLGLEKFKSKAKAMHNLKNQKEQTIQDQEKILQEQHNFIGSCTRGTSQ